MLARPALCCFAVKLSTPRTFRLAPIATQSLRMASTLLQLPVFEAIASHEPQRPAVIHCLSGRRFTYGGLLRDVADAEDKLRQAAGDQMREGQRVAFLVENGYDYVGANQVGIGIGCFANSTVTLLSILGSNSIAVPLSSGFPVSELRYILENSEASMLLSSSKFQSKAEEVVKEGLEKPLKVEVVEKRLGGNDSAERIQLQNPSDDAGGMMLYTSGTTSRPVRRKNPVTEPSTKNLIHRKAFFCPTQSSLRNVDPSSKPGNTARRTTSSTSSLSTTSMVLSTPSSRPFLQGPASNSSSPSTPALYGTALRRLSYPPPAAIRDSPSHSSPSCPPSTTVSFHLSQSSNLQYLRPLKKPFHPQISASTFPAPRLCPLPQKRLGQSLAAVTSFLSATV